MAPKGLNDKRETMEELLRKLSDDSKELQKFWGYEALIQQVETGRKYAEGVSYGFELAAAILGVRKLK